MDKTFAIYNFGCKVNQEEGGALAALFSSLGWRQEPEQPQLIIINTCTVTAVAEMGIRDRSWTACKCRSYRYYPAGAR